MQNKPNFRDAKMNITLDTTSKYEISPAGSGQKTKPIQTQLNPIQSQFKPKQTQFKPNFLGGYNKCAETLHLLYFKYKASTGTAGLTCAPGSKTCKIDNSYRVPLCVACIKLAHKSVTVVFNSSAAS